MANPYSSLTPAQQAITQHAVNKMVRPGLGQFQIALTHLQVALNEYNANGVGTLLAGTTTTEVVPNDSNLAGTGDLTVADVTGMISSITTFLGTYNASGNQQTYVKWAGGPQVIG